MSDNERLDRVAVSREGPNGDFQAKPAIDAFAWKHIALNTAADAASPAVNSQRAQITARAVAAQGRTWPEQLTSGAMFYEGERITKAEFMAEVRA